MFDLGYFLKSFLNLLLMRVVSRVIPILMSGYIIKTTGLRSFGNIEFAKVLNYFFKLIIAYGFIYTIPAYLYKCDDRFRKDKLPALFGSIVLIKFVLSILCFFLLLLVFYLFPFLRKDFSIILFFFFVAVFSGFTPICIYQGLGKLHIITALNSLTKFFFYFSIPFYVKSENDIIYYPIVYSVVEFLRVLFSYFILFYFYKVGISFPNISFIKKQVCDGFSAFCFSFYIFFCDNFPILFLKVYLGNIYVGIYKLGSNVLYLCQQILEPFIQCSYPIIKGKFNIDIKVGLRFALKVLLAYVSLFLLISILCLFYSTNIVRFFCSSDFIVNNKELFDSAVIILNINILVFLMSIVSSFIGMHIFANFGIRYLYSIVLFIGGIISVVLHFSFVFKYNVIGASLAVLSGEFFVFLMMCVLFLYRFVKIKIIG